MRFQGTLVLISGLLLSVAASASDIDGAAKPVVHHHHRHAMSVAELQRQVAMHQAEVQKLQLDVGAQELASRQASDKLQQQDRTIAELQKQLQEVQARPAANQH
jgi:uncharacterized small protein (DUF1192 family)